ncbi:hypothetical protein NGB36_26885 [Streptomyces sp. RB6PN25]|uniref:Integral membrane protein n=1 Tax=Streptomyces humicola TaxID=2953240 RepID=A0ABT1Q2F2_9ACTN|nr:hypothetical protein [Streptomyces humicola]MCQ4084101.1 hypothetical protein [Streptomyces humicola]
MRRSWLGALREALVWWALLVVVDLMFISTVSVLELVVAAGGAAIAAVAARGVHTVSGAGPGGTRRWGAAALAWPGAVLTDTVRLFAVTARTLCGRPVEGRWQTVTLVSGTGAAWACGLLSSTPGAYVVDVRGQQPGAGEALVVHVVIDDRTRLERVLTAGGRR